MSHTVIVLGVFVLSAFSLFLGFRYLMKRGEESSLVSEPKIGATTAPSPFRQDATEEAAAAKHIAASPEWYYFGRNNSSPALNDIACGCPQSGNRRHFARAALVFEALNLDLAGLRLIFLGDSSVAGELKQSPYDALGYCVADDDEGWKKLARMVQKTIHFVHCHGEPYGFERAVYYPDGSMKLVRADT